MVGAAAAGVYWLVLFLPLYIDNWEVRDKVVAAFNQYPLTPLDRVRTVLKGEIDSLKFGTHSQYDPVSGDTKTMPGLGLTDEQVVTEDDPVRRWFRVAVTFDRVVTLFPTEKQRTLHFVIEKKGPYAH